MTEDSFTLIAARSKLPLKFFLLVFALSLPFWLAGTLTSLQLLPALPISALMFVCPVTAAAALVYRENKSTGVRELLKRTFDFKRVKAKIWYVPTILLMPCIMVLSYGAIHLIGVSVTAPAFSIGTVLTLFIAFFIGALGEELGWSGYAIDPLQERLGPLGGALLLGGVWAVWHYVPLLQVHRSLGFIAWWSLATVAYRVIIVWLYNNTGRSVFVAALFHTMIDLTWQLFPINGSYYDPRVTGLITAIVAGVVIIVWGPRTLACYSVITTIPFVRPGVPPPSDCAPPISAWPQKGDCAPSLRTKKGARRSQHG
jgi:membrane protease YdiL (CAAX protease family)